MNIEVTKKPKATLEIKITIPNDKVKETYNKVVEELVKNTEIDGFRKGKAPKDVVLERADKQKLNSEVMNELLQTYYPQALKEKHITPVSNPQVQIKEFDLTKDFEFTALVADKPDVKVKDNYIEQIKKQYEQKRKNIQKENEDKLKKGEELNDTEHIHLSTEEIIEVLLDSADFEVSDLVVDEETDRMMARLINQAQSIGMTLESYLQTQNKTGEQLRNEYKKIAEDNVKIEFILSHLIQKENIEATEEEIQSTIDSVGDENVRKQMETPLQRFYIKTVLEKNKLITQIIKEVEGENYHEHTHE